MSNEKIDVRDLQDFIDGLKNSLDMLEGADPAHSKGFQAQLAIAISKLRIKRSEQFEPLPKFIGKVTKEDIKKYLLDQLETLNNYLDNEQYPQGKFKLVMEIAQLRAEIRNL